MLKGYDHEQHDDHPHKHADLNLLAAYTHVLADAMTSVLAIVALIGGRLLHWNWLDPTMGIVGAVVISVVAGQPKATEDYKALRRAHKEIAHVTVEISRCPYHAQL
ncbi:MAG: cation transporter [Anaerolineae bacterium]